MEETPGALPPVAVAVAGHIPPGIAGLRLARLVARVGLAFPQAALADLQALAVLGSLRLACTLFCDLQLKIWEAAAAAVAAAPESLAEMAGMAVAAAEAPPPEALVEPEVSAAAAAAAPPALAALEDLVGAVVQVTQDLAARADLAVAAAVDPALAVPVALESLHCSGQKATDGLPDLHPLPAR